MNVSVAIQDQPTTIEESALISLCYLYMKIPLSVFFLVLSLLPISKYFQAMTCLSLQVIKRCFEF
jgi:hypothetical protein